MPRVIEDLRREHSNIARLLDLLERQVELLESAGAPDYSLMLEIMEYTLNYPDLYHHPKEDLVFRKLIERDANAAAAARELIEEHEALGRATREFADTLRNVSLDAEVPRAHVIARAREYIDLNRRHMEKEETNVFPLALQSLEAGDWAEIEAARAPGEDPLFGGALERQYDALRESIFGQAPEAG